MRIVPVQTQEDIDRNTVIMPYAPGDARQHAIQYWPFDAASIHRMTELPAPNHTANVRRSVVEGETHFFGTSSWDKNYKAFLGGWPEGLTMAEGIIKRLALSVKAQAPTMVYRASPAPINGLAFNYVDMITGGPNPFVGKYPSGEQKKRGKKIVRFALNICVSSGVGTNLIMARGAVCMALIKMLERAKISTSVDVLYHVGNSWTPTAFWTGIWRIKEAGQEMSPTKLVYTLGHPSAFRRTMFGFYEHAPKGFGNCSGYGSPRPANQCPKFKKDYDIFVDSDSMMGDPDLWTNPIRQEMWIKDMLKEQGVKCF